MVGRHKINGPSKQVVVETDLIPLIEARKGESLSKKIRLILQENEAVQELKDGLAQERIYSEARLAAVDDLQYRINFSRKVGSSIPYPPWINNKHRIIGASFCLTIPRDAQGKTTGFELVYSNCCKVCGNGNCKYDAEELAYLCSLNTQQGMSSS